MTDKVAKLTDKDKEAAMRDTKQKGIEIRTHHASELAELTRSHRRKTFVNSRHLSQEEPANRK